MPYSRRHFLATYFSLLSVFALALFAPDVRDASTLPQLARHPAFTVPAVFAEAYEASSKGAMENRIAARLRARLHAQGKITPPLHAIVAAVRTRQMILGNHVSVQVGNPDGTPHSTWDVSLQKYPLWLKPRFSLTSAAFVLDSEAISTHLEREGLPGILKPTDVEVKGIAQEKGFTRVETTGVAKHGQALDVFTSVATVSEALMSGRKFVSITLLEKPGALKNMTSQDLGELSLLATGRSDFSGSPYNRIVNVRKALREHVNNTMVLPGETFSFNSSLEGPVTESRGWKMAKVIFGGDEIRPAPGGGICQASTTVYRAIVHAGFPVIERKAHSLYVTYYEEFGVGIDATIFPGSQDLVFLNDTQHPLVIQAYDQGSEAVVNIYGTPDGRQVDLAGPYFNDNQPEELRVNGRRLASNEIAWVQKVLYPDGSEKESVILSRYKELPLHVKNEYAYAEE